MNEEEKIKDMKKTLDFLLTGIKEISYKLIDNAPSECFSRSPFRVLRDVINETEKVMLQNKNKNE